MHDDLHTGITYEWKGTFHNKEVNALHAEAFDHGVLDDDWVRQVHGHSLGWVCARRREELVGFVNVPWDGGVHAFLMDTMVSSQERGHGIGRQMVSLAVDGATTAGCEWLHVDFDDSLRHFYFEGCGFTPTAAGVISLPQT